MLGISRSTGCQRLAALVYDHEVEPAELDAAPVLAGPVDAVKDGGREPGLELAKGLQLGLTGADWPGGPKASPAAWKISLLGSDGTVLAEHKSFLWEKPAK